MDDFGVRFFDKLDLNHLIAALKTKYKISTDFSGKNYCGLTINWRYSEGFVDIYMPGLIIRSLEKFQHKPNIPQYSPHEYYFKGG